MVLVGAIVHSHFYLVVKLLFRHTTVRICAWDIEITIVWEFILLWIISCVNNHWQFRYFSTKERTAVCDTGHPMYQINGCTMSINIPDLPTEVFHCGIFKYLTDVDILNISRAGNVRLKEIATDYLKCKEPE